jgi:hypothetical protein
MIAKRISLANSMRLFTTHPVPAARANGKAARWPFVVILMICFVALAPRAGAQSAKLADDPPPPYDASEPAADAPPPAPDPAATSAPAGPIDTAAGPAKPAEADAAPSAPAAPVFDPLHADKSMDVGTFYLKKGDYDAAIDRFEEAARYNP